MAPNYGNKNGMYKGVDIWVKENQGKHFCKCGCGGIIIIKDHHFRSRFGIPDYLTGHNNKDKFKENHPSYKGGIPASNRRQKARRRHFGFEPINKLFINSEAHHLHIHNSKEVLYIPKEIHSSILHRFYDEKSMNKINKLAFEWLATQETI